MSYSFTQLQKVLIIAAVLVALLVLLAWQVWGSSTLGVTLRSNDALENGLVGHWTFDGSDMAASTSGLVYRDTVGSGRDIAAVSSFGTGGVITGIPATIQAQSVVSDGTNLYVAGQFSTTTTDVRIEKRLMSTGEYVSGFGVGGAVLSTTTSNNAAALAQDGTYLYVGGQSDTNTPLIEKRLMSDGSLVTAFDSDGYLSTTTVGYVDAIKVSGGYLYIFGLIGAGNDWWIEKRQTSDGALVSAFGSGGYIQGSAATIEATDAYLDGTNLYVVGGQDIALSIWRIEKRSMSDGSLVAGFGTGGVATSTPDAANPSTVSSVTSDGTNLYIAGNVDSGLWRVEKRLMSNGSLVSGFGAGGVATSASPSYAARHITSDSTNLYVFGDEGSGVTFDWRMEKRSMSDGSLVSGFGAGGVVTANVATYNLNDAVLDSTYLYAVGAEGSLGSTDWRIEKRLLSSGALAEGSEPIRGVLGQAVAATNAYALGAGPTSVNAVAFWLNTASTTQPLIQLNDQAYISLASGTVTPSAGFTSPTVYVNGVAGTTLPSGTWAHVVVTSGTAVNATSTKFCATPSGVCNALWDDLRLYSRALTSEDARRLYGLGATTRVGVTLENPVYADGLVGHWTLDGKDTTKSGGATVMIDRGSGGHNGTLTATGLEPIADTYTSAGTTTWQAPTGVTSVSVEAWGGGGAGARCTTAGRGCGGGGAGEYAKEATYTVVPGNSYEVVVGAGGVSATAVAGGTSKFNSTGVVANGGGTPAVDATAGAAGGTGSSNTVHNNGGAGGNGGGSGTGGGGGGEAGGASGTGDIGSNGTSGVGGAGGSGVNADGGDGGAGGSTGSEVGTQGSSPGGAGGGGKRVFGGTNGGAGAAGQVKISYLGSVDEPVPGPLGQAWSFNGISTKIDPGDVGSGLKTIAFWVRFSTTTASQAIIQLDATARIETDSSRNVVCTNCGAATIYINGSSASANIPRTGEWFHVAVAVSGGVAGTTFRMGYAPSGSQYLGGALDDVRVYSRVLARDEIARLYGLGATTRVGVTAASIQDALVGHWTFDGPKVDLSSTTAEILDSSGNNNRGNWLAHSSTTAIGVLGQAIEFDGSNDYIEIPTKAAYDVANGTVAFWVKARNFPGSGAYDSIVSRHADGSATGFNIALGASGDIFYQAKEWSTTVASFGGGYLQRDQWYHVAAVFTQANGGMNYLYINGVSTGSGANSAAWTFNSSPIRFADSLHTYWEIFDGQLDDIRYYSRALTPAEIQRLYELGT